MVQLVVVSSVVFSHAVSRSKKRNKNKYYNLFCEPFKRSSYDWSRFLRGTFDCKGHKPSSCKFPSWSWNFLWPIDNLREVRDLQPLAYLGINLCKYSHRLLHRSTALQRESWIRRVSLGFCLRMMRGEDYRWRIYRGVVGLELERCTGCLQILASNSGGNHEIRED